MGFLSGQSDRTAHLSSRFSTGKAILRSSSTPKSLYSSAKQEVEAHDFTHQRSWLDKKPERQHRIKWKREKERDVTSNKAEEREGIDAKENKVGLVSMIMRSRAE